jgi:hypothetical protein
MAITRALEFDQTPNRLLFEIGEQARQQELMQRKLAQENQEKQFQVLQQINPAALSSKFEREVVDQTIGELTAGMANYIKQHPNASYIDLQNMVNQNLGQVSQWSAKVKSIKENIDKSISLRDSKDPYDRGRLRALAIDRALYNTDQSGRKMLKGPEEIDLDSDIISQVIADNEDKLIDPYKGEQAMTDKINDASLYTQNTEQTVETPDGRKTVVVGQKSSVPFFLEAKDGELRVKQQDDGYIAEDVFQRFYQDPAIRANVNANAKSNMQKIGVPDSPEAFEYFKRAYLTTWLEGNKKGVIDRTDKTLYQKPAESKREVPANQDYINAFQEIDSLASAKKKGMGAPLNELALETQKVVLDMAKSALGMTGVGQGDVYVKKENDGTIGVYTGKDILDDDNNVVRSINSKIGTLTSTGTNVAANKSAKSKAAVIKDKPSGKSISKSEFMKMSIADRQSFLAGGGTYK